jgi:DNA-binding GntR family transcriptional regulator
LTVDFIPEALLSKHAATQLDRDSSLLGVLEAQAGERIALAVSHLHPIAATADLVRSLKVARRQPLLMLRETYYLESGNPVLYGEVFLNTELLSFHVRRRPLELPYSRT